MAKRGTVKVDIPIQQAFIDKSPISYYSYGYGDGTSAPVDNDFAKRMEDSLLHALLYDGDSTGIAHLNPQGDEYTASQFTLPHAPASPDMPLNQEGHDDYSYSNCVSEFTDARDGQKYKAVCIGKQNWMAENLRYNASGSDCYPTADCNKYGRLYEWSTVMNSSAASTANPSGVQGICPKGWHIPSQAEWQQLITTIGGQHSGGALKATADWNSPNLGATNAFGFTALGGGQYYPDSNAYYFLNQEGYWWSASLGTNPNSHYYAILTSSGKDIIMGNLLLGDDKYKFSCRCLKD